MPTRNTQYDIEARGRDLRDYRHVLGKYAGEVQFAAEHAAERPRPALQIARIATEHLLKGVLRRKSVEFGEKAKFEELFQAARKHLPRSVQAQVELIQDLGNLGSHDTPDELSAQNARLVLDALLGLARHCAGEVPVPVPVEVEPDRARPPRRRSRALVLLAGLAGSVGIIGVLGVSGVVVLALIAPRAAPPVQSTATQGAAVSAPAPSPLPPAPTTASASPVPAADAVDPAPDAPADGTSAPSTPEISPLDPTQDHGDAVTKAKIWRRPLAPDELGSPPAEAVYDECMSGGQMLTPGDPTFGWVAGRALCDGQKLDGWIRVDPAPPLRPRADPERAAVRRKEADDLAREGKWPDAIDAYSRAIEHDPADPELYALRARARFEDGRTVRALGDIALALTGDQNCALALYERAAIEHSRGDARWEETLNAALKADPSLQERVGQDPRLQGAAPLAPADAELEPLRPNASVVRSTGVFREQVKPRAALRILEQTDPDPRILARIPELGTRVQVVGWYGKWLHARVEVDGQRLDGWMLKDAVQSDE